MPSKRPLLATADRRRRSKLEDCDKVSSGHSIKFSRCLLFDRTGKIEGLRDSYARAKPFPHLQLKEVFATDFLRAVRAQVIENCSGSLKETDIYKVYQTGELRNLDALRTTEQARLGKLRSLRDLLYSERFRRYLEDLTGCCDPSRGEHLDGDQIDCSINVYTQGCHLLCHDDAIGTRRLSYILYLTEPDRAWAEEDGGRLQLFALNVPEKDQEDSAEPQAYPSVSLLPEWNTMTVFQVLPGRSFHAVEEVRSSETPRLSISGWYHVRACKDADEEGPEASLQQLQRRRQQPLKLFAWPAPVAATVPAGEAEIEKSSRFLSDADREYLHEYLQPEYLQDKTLRVIRAQFCRDSSIQLHNFLRIESIVQPLLKALRHSDAAWRPNWQDPDKRQEMHQDPSNWVTVGPAHRQRFLAYHALSDVQPPIQELESMLDRLDKLFSSLSMARYFALLTGIDASYGRFRGYHRRIRRFRPGLDYMLATHDSLVPPEEPFLLDATLCFVDDSDADSAEQWQSGEFGGYECYIDAGDGDDDPSIYRDTDEIEDDSNPSNHLLNLPPASNTLNLVLRDHNVLRFVKYISDAAPSSRLDLAYEYALEGGCAGSDHAPPARR
jgi:Rps23 Pro-64 3,4-dihydroxylase Tpa1-like proline 4-hydroxylase